MDEKAYIKLFNYIFMNHRERYIRFAYSYTYNHETAEDLVAESLMYYWENRDRLEDVKDIPLYILIIIKNKCLDHLQRERTWKKIAENLLSNKEWELQMRISSLEACEPEALFSAEVQELIKKTLDKLPEKSSRIFMMSRYDFQIFETIVREWSLCLYCVWFHISNALTALRKDLKDYLPALLSVFDFFYN